MPVDQKGGGAPRERNKRSAVRSGRQQENGHKAGFVTLGKLSQV